MSIKELNILEKIKGDVKIIKALLECLACIVIFLLNRKDLNYIFYALSCYAKDCPQLPEPRNNEDKMQKQNDVLNTRKKIKKSMAV